MLCFRINPAAREISRNAMVRPTHERVLLIGDPERHVHSALVQALPGAHVTSVGTYFDAIAELVANPYTSILAAAEPIERRPEAAMKTLRKLAGDGRVLLFGHPTLEPLSRKMLDFGCDDYVVTPIAPAELQQMFGRPPLRLAPSTPATEAATEEQAPAVSPSRISLLSGLPLAEIFLDGLLQHPHDAPAAVVAQLNAQIAPTMQVTYTGLKAAVPQAPDGAVTISHAVRVQNEELGLVHLVMPRDEDENAARHFLAQLAHLLGKSAALQDRHNRLQKLAITDDLTGVYNGRYFRHFLTKIIEKAKTLRFPVTLLLFDIDDFKSYNDRYGHGVGDEILKQTAALMKRCSRDHDLVARISGDEFAVVFWEKDGPRQPREPQAAPVTPGRPPQTPQQILERFRRLLASQEFTGIGPAGKGVLTISGGMAVYPYDASDASALIEEADRRLMFGAKKSGKNSIVLVGQDKCGPKPDVT